MVALTMIGPIEFGSRWRKMIRRVTRPSARAASTVLLLPQRQEHAAHDAGDSHPPEADQDEGKKQPALRAARVLG